MGCLTVNEIRCLYSYVSYFSLDLDQATYRKVGCIKIHRAV